MDVDNRRANLAVGLHPAPPSSDHRDGIAAYLGVVPEDEDGLAPAPADRREPTESQRHAGRDAGAA